MLLHGLVGSGRFWGGAYDRLASTHHLVVPDLLGFGRSERPDVGYGPDDHARAVAGALDQLGVTEPVVIGAHSLGCVVALRLATLWTERVRRIVGFGPPIYPDIPTARRRIGASSPMARLFVLPGPAAEMACRWVCGHREMAVRWAPLTHPSLPPPIAADAVQHTWHSYDETLERCLLTAEPATWLGGLKAPVHLVAGRSDPVVDRPFLDGLAGRFTGVTTEWWPGRHRLPLREPDRCLSLLL